MEKVLIIQVCEVPVWHTHHGFTVFINLSSVLKNLSPVLTRHRVLSFQVCVWHTHTHIHTQNSVSQFYQLVSCPYKTLCPVIPVLCQVPHTYTHTRVSARHFWGRPPWLAVLYFTRQSINLSAIFYWTSHTCLQMRCVLYARKWARGGWIYCMCTHPTDNYTI